MENMKQSPDDAAAAEAIPDFLRDFVQEVERTRDTIESNPEQTGHFLAHGATKRVRKGNFSDFLMMKEQIMTRAADHVLYEMQEKMRTEKTVSREDHHREKIAAKLVASYHTQEKFFAEYAEAKDDWELAGLASVMEDHFPYLKEMHEKYTAQFAAGSSKT